VYWLNVDYLVVAQAAIRLQAPLTATLLVEHWLEDKTGTVSLNAMDSQGQTSDAVPPYLTLLLEAQSKLSEPDGLYGLLRSNSLELQLHLSEHEGHWDRALAGYDLLQSDVENNYVSSVVCIFFAHTPRHFQTTNWPLQSSRMCNMKPHGERVNGRCRLRLRARKIRAL
jgi:hypothetical protein